MFGMEVARRVICGSWRAAQTEANMSCDLQEYNPDLTHNISKKERLRKGADGIMLTNVTTAVDHAQAGERGR